jgi:ATP-dependent DNA helicase RecG
LEQGFSGVFYRAGLIEKWGRGTNRVAEMCKTAGVAQPEFTEIGGAAVVTFRTDAGLTRRQLESRPESRPESAGGALESRVVAALKDRALARSELARALGQKGVPGQFKKAVSALLARGIIEYTIPEKPGSRLQKYRLVKPARPQ